MDHNLEIRQKVKGLQVLLTKRLSIFQQAYLVLRPRSSSPSLTLRPLLSVFLRLFAWGGESTSATGVIKGASVYIVNVKTARLLCGGDISDDRVCLDDSTCQIASYVKSRTLIREGIYVTTSSTAHLSMVAINDPVGDLSLLDHYGDFIMSNLATTPRAWQTTFEV